MDYSSAMPVGAAGGAPQPGSPFDFRGACILIAAAVAVLLGMVFVPAAHFALAGELNVSLHTLLETVSIIVSALVFSAGWNAFRRERSSSVALICNAFFAVAVLDFVHLLSFEGMPPLVTPSGAGKAIPTFLAARLLAGLALLAIALLPWERRIEGGRRNWLFALSLVFALGVAVPSVMLPEVRVLFFIPGAGQTTLKVTLEYLIIALNLAAALALLARQGDRGNYPVAELFAAACLAALSEVCFTLYARTIDQYNMLGHLYKVLAYVAIYRALFVTLVRQPYAQLESARRALEDSEEKYRVLFENSMDGVLLTSSEGAVLAANPAACAMFGIAEEAMVRLGAEAVVGSGGEQLKRLVAERARSGKARGAVTLRRADGTAFAAEISSALYADRAGRAAASTVVRDISERQRAQDEILRLNASLE